MEKEKLCCCSAGSCQNGCDDCQSCDRFADSDGRYKECERGIE